MPLKSYRNNSPGYRTKINPSGRYESEISDKKLLTNRATAEALNQRANEMAELAYSFAEAVQLTVERKNIPAKELGMFANFASRSIQKLPEVALDLAITEGTKTIATHGPKVVKLLKELDWNKIRGHSLTDSNPHARLINLTFIPIQCSSFCTITAYTSTGSNF